MLEKIEQPYEFLCRWRDGVLTGAHVGFITQILEDGKVLQQTTGEVMPVDIGQGKGFPLDQILPHIHAGAIAQMDAANADCAKHKADLDAAVKREGTLQIELDAAKAALADADAKLEQANLRIAELEAKNQEILYHPV